MKTSKAKAIQTAAKNAKEIVSANSKKSDSEKLKAYKNKICELTDYNWSAVENNVAYGNPWQLVWVFDGDPNTKVVCEGYSKAFQYLWELSSFNGDITSMRMTGNTLISAAVRLTTGKKLTDPTSGMRMYGRSILEKMAYGIAYRPEPDTVAFLIRSGAKVEEVQVTMRERTAGESYLSFGKSIKYMVQMFMNILLIQWVRKRG